MGDMSEGRVSHLGVRLTALVDGELDHDDRERALAHLAMCPACRREADALRQVKERLRGLSDLTPSAGLSDRLLALGAPRTLAGEGDEVADPGRSMTFGWSGDAGEFAADGRQGARGRRTGRAGVSAGRGPAAGRPVARRPRTRPAVHAADLLAAAPSLLPDTPILGTRAAPSPLGPGDMTLMGAGSAAPDTAFLSASTATGSPPRRRAPLVRNLAMGAATFAIFGAGATAVAITGSETAQARRVAPALQRFSLEYALRSGARPMMQPIPAGRRTTTQTGTPTLRSSP